MNILKKRSTAAVIAVIVVLVATLFGVHRSIAGAVKDVESQFYNGVYVASGKYTQPGISVQLKVRENAAVGLVTIAANYSTLSNEADALRQARTALSGAGEISAMYTANADMQRAFEALYSGLMQQQLTDQQKTAAASYASTFSGAQTAIQNSAYNNSVSQFVNGTMKSFPVNLLKNLAFTREPEYFGAEG